MVNDTATRLLARIRKLREANGLTQETFAEKAGLDYKHYQAVEAGRRPDLRLSTLIKMAEALELELKELFDLNAPVSAVAEDPPTSGKGAYKVPRRRSGEKGG